MAIGLSVAAAFFTGGWNLAFLEKLSLILGELSLGIGVAGSFSGSKILTTTSKILGITSAITGVASLYQSLTQRLATTAVSNASLLSSSATAGNQGLTQTSSLYTSTGAMNASATGANSISINTLSNGGYTLTMGGTTQIGGAYSGLSYTNFSQSIFSATGDKLSFFASSAIQSGTTPLLTSTGGAGLLEIAQNTAEIAFKGYKIFSDTKMIFKKPNDFSDDEMPVNSDEKCAVAVKSDSNELIRRRFYDINEIYDLGLEQGTLLYLESVRQQL